MTLEDARALGATPLQWNTMQDGTPYRTWMLPDRRVAGFEFGDGSFQWHPAIAAEVELRNLR